MLLQCDQTQIPIIEILLKKMPIYADEETYHFKTNPILTGKLITNFNQ